MIVKQIFFLQQLANFRIEWEQGLLEPLSDQSDQFETICSPIPGSFTGYLLFLVFGTTAESQAEIRKMRLAIRRWCWSKGDENKNPSFDGLEPDPTSGSQGVFYRELEGFSSRGNGILPNSMISIPPTHAPPFRARDVGDNYQFARKARYGQPMYSPSSSVSTPATSVPPGYSIPQQAFSRYTLPMITHGR